MDPNNSDESTSPTANAHTHMLLFCVPGPCGQHCLTASFMAICLIKQLGRLITKVQLQDMGEA